MPSDASRSPSRTRKVLYSIVALLLGLGSFIGAGTVQDLFEDHSEPAASYNERAEQIEDELTRGFQNPELLLALSLAHLYAGNELREGVPSKEEVIRALRHYREASAAWSKYLGATDSLSPEAVQQIAPMFSVLAENASDLPGFKAEVGHAAASYEVLAKQSPSINTLMLLAYYRYFAFENRAGDHAVARALALSATAAETQRIKRARGEYRRQAAESKGRITELLEIARRSEKEPPEQ